MRKSIILAQIVLLFAVVIVACAGCGNDTPKAKKFMQDGDKLAQQYEVALTAWEQNINSATSLADLDKIKAAENDLSKTAGEARSAYKEILPLKGVEDYAKYANLQIEALAKQQEMVTLTNSYLDKLAPMINSGDVTNLASISEKYSSDVNKLNQESAELTGQAEKLKIDKSL